MYWGKRAEGRVGRLFVENYFRDNSRHPTQFLALILNMTLVLHGKKGFVFDITEYEGLSGSHEYFLAFVCMLLTFAKFQPDRIL